MDELPTLIEVIFSNDDEGNMVHRLVGEEAQIFTDVVDEVWFSFVRHSQLLTNSVE